MKITGKITGSILLLGLLCGLCAIPILLLGFPEWIDSRHSMEESHVTEWLLLCGLGGLVLGFLLTVLVLLRIIRRVVLPLRDAIDFADRLAAGEFPSRLAEYGNSNDEVRLLYTALNLLRDRQMNLNSKLKLRLSREAETRRDAESHSMLQLRIIARMLPEMRIPLGSIKGFCRILLLELESEKPDRREMVRLLDETGHRVGMISRQIDRLLDISRLDRDRWDRFEAVEFNTAELMRELVAFNLISLQAREVMLVNHFSASAPERIVQDRELLHQLLTIMILSVGRAAAAGETLVLSCFREDHRVMFEVCDSRHAPLRESLAELFRAYEESHDPEASAAENLSISILGLVFARELAAKLGGVLRVFSTERANAVLRFELSDSCVSRTGESLLTRSTGRDFSPREPESPRRLPPPEGKRIQVLHGTEVADAPLLLGRLLGAQNIDVHSFTTAAELLEEIRKAPYDFLVVSPTLKGYELPILIGELRKAAGRRDLPVVVIASSFSDEFRRELASLGRVFPLNVPVNFALLGRLIRESVAGREVRN